MYFLGQAASFHFKDVLRHTFAFGTSKDSDRLKSYLKAKYHATDVVLYHTGRTALAQAIRLVAPPETQVIVTALTCYAVVEAVRAAGCAPVFADIEPETLHFNGKTLENCLKLHPHASAIIIQNNLGHPCKIQEIEAVAGKYQLPLIEDLAHSAGISYADGRPAGTVGSAAILSFGKGKAIDTTSGGALLIKKTSPSSTPHSPLISQPSHLPCLSARLRDRWYPFFGALIRLFYHIGLGKLLTALLLKLHFIERSADAELKFDTRLTHWQAKLALRQLEQLPPHRPPLREFYFVKNRPKVLAELAQNGFIMYDTWYDTPVAPARYFEKSGFLAAECPVATKLSKHIVNLPTFYPPAALTPARQIIQKHSLDLPEHLKKSKLPREDFEKNRNFLQSEEWGKVNIILGHKTIWENHILMVIKDARRGRYLEIPGGPVIDWDDPKIVQNTFADIIKRARAENCVFIRFRPQLTDTPENQAKIAQIPGIRPAPFHLGAQNTVIIDLEKPLEAILSDMRRQTRYEVRRVPKVGLEVRNGHSDADFQEFHEVQLETARRQNFIPPTSEDLAAYHQVFGPDAVIYQASLPTQEDSSTSGPVAYGLILKHGAEVEYFEAASTDLNRKLPGSYAILWQIIQDAKKEGYKRFNLWGIAPPDPEHPGKRLQNHRYSGVTTFKTGFGGSEVDFIPAQDIVINRPRYLKVELIEKIRKKRRHL